MYTEEFYEVYECSWNVAELNLEPIHWEHVYSCVRPHQALNYKTLLQFLRDSGIVHSSYPESVSYVVNEYTILYWIPSCSKIHDNPQVYEMAVELKRWCMVFPISSWIGKKVFD